MVIILLRLDMIRRTVVDHHRKRNQSPPLQQYSWHALYHKTNISYKTRWLYCTLMPPYERFKPFPSTANTFALHPALDKRYSLTRT